jgi:hypothetical protein
MNTTRHASRGGTEQMRVLLSVERRHSAYGEALAEAIGALRPRLEVALASPEEFEQELGRLGPELVVCGRPEPAGFSGALAWVELLVDADRPTKVRVGGHRREVINPSFIELVAVVDEAWTLARPIPVVA